MAEPITWRSLANAAPEPKDALLPMVYGARTINDGFDALQKTLGTVTANNEANWQNQKVNNTQALMDELRGAKTPEQMAALEQSGRLQEMQQTMGAQFDRNAFNAALDARPGILRDNLTKEQQFAQNQAIAAHDPIAKQVQAKYAAGDIAGGDALIASFPQAPQAAALAEMRRTILRQNVTDTQGAELHGIKVADAPVNRALTQAQTTGALASAAATTRNAATNETNAATNAYEASARAVERQTDAESKAAARQAEAAGKQAAAKLAGLEKDGNLYAKGVLTQDKMEDLRKMMKDKGMNDEAQAKVIARLTNLNGKYGLEVGEFDAKGQPVKDANGKHIVKKQDVPIPYSAVVAAIMGAENNWFKNGSIEFNNRNEGYAENVIGSLDNQLKNTFMHDLGDGRKQWVNKATTDYAAYGQVMRNAIVPSAQKKTR